VKKVPGVESAEFNLATSQLRVVAKGQMIDRRIIAQAVKNMGHKVEEEEKGKAAVLRIEGMDCEDEVYLLARKMKSLKGLESFRVNLMSQSLQVRYDPAFLSIQEIIKSMQPGMTIQLCGSGISI